LDAFLDQLEQISRAMRRFGGLLIFVYPHVFSHHPPNSAAFRLASPTRWINEGRKQ